MVDWDRVEELRAKGWDWERISEDPKVGFRADSGVSDTGRALRVLYFQRRSRQKGRSTDGPGGSGSRASRGAKKWTLARVGYLLVPLFGLWFVLAYFFPSPVGVYLPAVPYIGLILAIVAFVLAFGLLRTADRWTTVYRNSLVIGAVLGLVIAGVFGLAAVVGGCPTLSSTQNPEPDQFTRSPDPSWTSGGVPVFFFMGSIACPYCSASSWAFETALDRIGTLSNTVLGHSNPSDSPPSVPEVELANATYTSSWITALIAEGTDDTQITTPALGSCTETAYVSSYDADGSIPFIVIGGTYVHVGTLVDPTQLVDLGLNASQVQRQVSAQNGSAWNLIEPAANWVTAYLLVVDGRQPSSVAAIPGVASDLNQIS
jgi:Domain of unknown function (DUF929)